MKIITLGANQLKYDWNITFAWRVLQMHHNITSHPPLSISESFQFNIVNKGFLVGVNISGTFQPSLASHFSDVSRLQHFSGFNIQLTN